MRIARHSKHGKKNMFVRWLTRVIVQTMVLGQLTCRDEGFHGEPRARVPTAVSVKPSVNPSVKPSVKPLVNPSVNPSVNH